MRKPLAAVMSALLVGFSGERSFAQAATFDVPAECGDEAAFTSELARLAGPDAERARPSLLRIARDADSGAYRLTLVTGGRTRELEHADCRVLVRSAAVIAAASVKADAVPATAPVPQPAAPPLPPPQVAPARHAPPPASHDGGETRWRGDLAAGAGVAAGVVPGVAGALELRGEMLGELLGASLGVRYFPPRFVAVEGRGVDIWGLGLRAAAVAAPLPALKLSLGLDAERLSGQGSGVARPRSDAAWTLAPSAEFAVIPFGNKHLALELAAEGRLALLRPVFVVTGFQDLYEVPSWGMVLVLRGAWHFP